MMSTAQILAITVPIAVAILGSMLAACFTLMKLSPRGKLSIFAWTPIPAPKNSEPTSIAARNGGQHRGGTL